MCGPRLSLQAPGIPPDTLRIVADAFSGILHGTRIKEVVRKKPGETEVKKAPEGRQLVGNGLRESFDGEFAGAAEFDAANMLQTGN